MKNPTTYVTLNLFQGLNNCTTRSQTPIWERFPRWGSDLHSVAKSRKRRRSRFSNDLGTQPLTCVA